jgi:DNA-directed RNA polymerase specialized sigma24 family protein
MSEEIRVSSRWSDREDDIRAKLRSYRSLVGKHKACAELYETLFPRMTQRFSDEPRGGQVEIFELESIVDQRMNLAMQMERSLHEMQVESNRIMGLLNCIPPDEFTIILRRYMKAQSWEEIAKAMNYCESHVRRKHDRAITRIGQNMSNYEQS